MTDQDEISWALVPVKRLQSSKKRLKTCLGADRVGFSSAMLQDVLRALAASNCLTHLAVVSADSTVAQIARGYGALIVDEIESRGMNAAIALGIEAVSRLGARGVAIVPADVPLATGREIDRLVRALQRQQKSSKGDVVGICASADGGGTNFLCLDTRRQFPLSFGPDSYKLHKQSALKTSNHPVLLHSLTLALDVDEAHDLDGFVNFCRTNPEYQETAAWQFLLENRYVRAAGQTGTG